MKKFLIIKTSAVGDVIAALDVLHYFTDAKIDWVVERPSASLLEACSKIRQVLISDTKAWRKNPFSKMNRTGIRKFMNALRQEHYDAVFDLQGNAKSGLFTLLSRSSAKVGFDFRSVPEFINILATDRKCRFNISKDLPVRVRNRQLIQSFFNDFSDFKEEELVFRISETEKRRLAQFLSQRELQNGLKIMVCFSSKWKNKQLPFSALIEFLQKIDSKFHPAFVFPYGNEKEKEAAEALAHLFEEGSATVGEMTLPFWQNLMQRVDCVISVDSASLHLAATTKTPCFCLFGPSHPSIYAPSKKSFCAIQGQCPYPVDFKTRCPKIRTCSSGGCMASISVDDMVEKFCLFQKLCSDRSFAASRE